MSLITDLWKKQDGAFFCMSTKSVTGQWKDHFIPRGRWGQIKKIIDKHPEHDIYMCPHGFSKASRQKPVSVDPHLLYADLDEADPKELAIRPTIAIQSSPGRYVGYWVTDKPASEELNRRLSYMVSADHSGWDRTQVLRVPNTYNYKYDPAPRVRVMWTSGPVYKLDDLETLIPEIKTHQGEDIDKTAASIFRRYEKKLPRWVRRDLFLQKVPTGKRSEVIWKLNNACLEAGMTRDEVFDLLWVSNWNKFRDRTNGADQLWRELDKAVDQNFSGFKADRDKTEEAKKWTPNLISMADVVEEKIDWLVPQLMARRELLILEGDPGVGKSYFAQIIAGLICDGKVIPCVEGHKPQSKGKVLYFDTENTASTVTKPRLVENGVKNLGNYIQGTEGFSVDDEERWEAVLEEVAHIRPDMVVFDTINTYIGGTDTYRSSETQQAMGYFKEIATRFNCAVVILRHLTKGSGGGKAIYRGQGSIAFTGAARIVVTVGRDPEDEEIRVVACTKNNISQFFKSFTYTIDGLPDTPKRTNRSRLTWGETTNLTSDDIVEAPNREKKGTRGQEKALIIEWLKETLGDQGRTESSKIYKMAEARGYSRTTVLRAADSLGVVKDLHGFGRTKKSWWSLL